MRIRSHIKQTKNPGGSIPDKGNSNCKDRQDGKNRVART